MDRLSHLLEHLVTGAAQDAPSAAAREHILARVQAAMASGADTSSQLAVGEVGVGAGGKLVGLLLAGAVVAAAVAAAAGPRDVPAAPSSGRPPAVVASSVATPLPAFAPPFPTAPATPPAPASTTEPPSTLPAAAPATNLASPFVRPRPAPRAASPSRKTADATAGLDEELVLLQGAQRALRDGDASTALAALRRHEREHPEGELREAREALAVAALCAAGDFTSVHRRRDAFLRSFPGSAYAAKVRRGCAVDSTTETP